MSGEQRIFKYPSKTSYIKGRDQTNRRGGESNMNETDDFREKKPTAAITRHYKRRNYIHRT